MLKRWVITTIKLLILIIIAKRKMQAIKIKIATIRIIIKSKTTRIRLFKIIVQQTWLLRFRTNYFIYLV
jgi:hypothetical protein